ncbi:hypothetical protein AKO1_010458 [Acrasis kona]|uniref:Protein kinase domain-containing protein n=1 Tax=Acrasis kona TaxID=1008807 RepID=A0AAW2ZJN0_9EUKA
MNYLRVLFISFVIASALISAWNFGIGVYVITCSYTLVSENITTPNITQNATAYLDNPIKAVAITDGSINISSSIFGLLVGLLYFFWRSTTTFRVLITTTISLFGFLAISSIAFEVVLSLMLHVKYSEMVTQSKAYMFFVGNFIAKTLLYTMLTPMFVTLHYSYMRINFTPATFKQIESLKLFSCLFMLIVFALLNLVGSISGAVTTSSSGLAFEYLWGFYLVCLLVLLCSVSSLFVAIVYFLWKKRETLLLGKLLKISVVIFVTTLVMNVAMSIFCLYMVVVRKSLRDTNDSTFRVGVWYISLEACRLLWLFMCLVLNSILFFLSSQTTDHKYHEIVAKCPELELDVPLINTSDISARDEFVADIRDWIVLATELSFDSKISEGAFGVVFKGKYLGSRVAIKMMKRVESEAEFEHEVRMLIMLRHPNIVLFMGACIASDYKYIVTELMDFALERVIHGHDREKKDQRHSCLPFTKKVSILRDVASALSFMNGRSDPVCHRDLKPSNILLDQYLNTAKVCDLGSSRKLSGSTMTAATGTYVYMSPEVIRGDAYTEKCDVYSFAIIMHELFFEIRPYSNSEEAISNDFMLGMKVTNGLRPPVFESERFTRAEDEYIILMKQCWSLEPDNRPSFQQILSLLDAIKNSH